MMGILSMWTGLMQVARASGLLEKMAEWLSPVIGFLFPKIKKDSKAAEYIATNMVANVLGLGWAATPAGLNAMKELDELRKTQGKPAGIATNDMCNFLILNISSLQLIPVNLIAYRSSYGSENPASIIAPAILATAFSTLVAVVFILLVNGLGKKNGRAVS
jgi:spore maturation protein A